MTKSERIEQLEKELTLLSKQVRRSQSRIIGYKKCAKERRTAISLLKRVIKTHYGEKVYCIEAIATKEVVTKFIKNIECTQ